MRRWAGCKPRLPTSWPSRFWSFRFAARAAYTELIRRVGDGELPISALSGTNKPGEGIPNPAESPWAKLWFDYQVVLYLEWMNEAIAIAKRPAAEHNSRLIAWQAKVDRIMQTSVEKFTVVLPILLSSGPPASGTALMRYQSELGATVILIAAERHRRKTGKWPSAIAEIDRSILSDAPVEPAISYGTPRRPALCLLDRPER